MNKVMKTLRGAAVQLKGHGDETGHGRAETQRLGLEMVGRTWSSLEGAKCLQGAE